ncbi:MAG: hypothetical protein AAB250_14915 [Bdellovibrionota bacterium]
MKFFKKALLVVCALSIFFAFEDDADARKKRRRRSRGRVKRRAVINEPNLYERIGGSKSVALLVDEWVRSALADGRLSGTWGDVTAKPATVVSLRKNLNAQLCELADGPCKTGKNEVAPIADEKFVVFADLLAQAMDKNDIREREKNEMLGRLGAAHDAEGEEETAE